ncbi:WD repeat-containing protein 46 isoform X3 [Taeniopygia guttata]|uniref:WD repeat-containing protein 46 isoform X3 n=1 Tax=Taeniopygia guttata TaxID=59729 RepID=UPI003BB8559A
MAAATAALHALAQDGAALDKDGAAHNKDGAHASLNTRLALHQDGGSALNLFPRRIALIGHALPALHPDWLRLGKWAWRVHMAAMAGGVSGRTDPFPGPAPVPRAGVKRFLRDSGEKAPRAVAPRLRWHLKNLGIREKSAAEKAARWEPLLPEEPGFLEAGPGQDSARIPQSEIAQNVDINSATKRFELRLEQFGPYRLDYSRNGRQLLLGGRRGHVAALDWAQRRLLSEFSVGEPVRDIRWLHSEALLAVAQRRYLHVYDSQGLEIHVLPEFQGILHLEFLPWHFLLAAVSDRGVLRFLDVSEGRAVSSLRLRCGRAAAMAQSPASANVLLGHANGVVSMWTPSTEEPVLRLLAHRGSVRGLAADAAGRLLATSGLDRKIRIFDLRNLGVLQEWGVPAGAALLDFSQRGLLAAACGDLLQIYPKAGSVSPPRPFLCHRLPGPARGLRFCPFEDVLGAGHGRGFSSVLVPGAGEPNFDALENNPYRSRRQRQEWEVKALLEKIPAELLTPDPALLGRVDGAALEQKRSDRIQRLGFDPDSQPRFRPRRRLKGRDPERRRRQQRHQSLRAQIQKSLEQKEKEKNEEEPPRKKRKILQKSGKKMGEKSQKSMKKKGENSKKMGEKMGEKLQKSRKKMGENPQKSMKKKGENPQKMGEKMGENPQKSMKKKGENPQKMGEKMGEKTPKNQEKGEGNAPKKGKKLPKNGQKTGKKPQGGGRGQKGGAGPKLGGGTPKLGGAPPKKGALDRFKK